MVGIIADRLILPNGPEEHGRVWQEHISPVFDIDFGRPTDLKAPMALGMNPYGEMVVGSVDTCQSASKVGSGAELVQQAVTLE